MGEEFAGGDVDGAAARRNEMPRFLIAGIVVVLIAAAATAGVVAGRATAPGPDIVIAAGPVAEEGPAAESLPAGSNQVPDALASISSDLNPTVHALQVSSMLRPDWPIVLSPVSDLADEPGVASGYRLTSVGVDGSGVAGALAGVFGIGDPAVAQPGGWMAGPADGSAPSVTVSSDPMVSWTFFDPKAAAATTGVPVEPDRARELAAELLGGIGVDIASVDWQVDRFSGLTSVTAWQLVEGARTHLAWQVGFGRDESVVSASGFAAALEEVPDYAVIGASSAVSRSVLPRWSAIGPMPIATAVLADAAPASPVPSVPPSAVAGRPVQPMLAVNLTEVTVTDAALGLAQFWQPDGTLLILPSYLLTGEDGSRWSLLAIADDYVDFVDQPYPSVVPPVE